jgi:hypothetical protein
VGQKSIKTVKNKSLLTRVNFESENEDQKANSGEKRKLTHIITEEELDLESHES